MDMLAGELLELLPAGPVESGGGGDVAEEAAPFELGALDIAEAEFVVGLMDNPAMGTGSEEDLGGAFAVGFGEAAVEVAGEGEHAEGDAAGGGEASGALIPFGKAMACADIGEVGEEVPEVVAFVLEGGGDGEAFAVVKEAEEAAAAGGLSVLIDEAEGEPPIGGGGVCGAGVILFVGEGEVDLVVSLAGGRVEEGTLGRVEVCLGAGLVEVEDGEELAVFFFPCVEAAAVAELGEAGEDGLFDPVKGPAEAAWRAGPALGGLCLLNAAKDPAIEDQFAFAVVASEAGDGKAAAIARVLVG